MLMVAWSVVRLIYWMLVVPYLIGQLFNFILPEGKKTIGITFILGFLIYIAIFEMVAIPCIINYVYESFTHCRQIYVVIVSLLAIGGSFRFSKSIFKREIVCDLNIETKIYYGIFIALVLFQVVMNFIYAPFNGDDAEYVTNSLIAQQWGSMNRIDPNVGGPIDLKTRNVLAAVTMWIAFIAKSSSVHATIVSHVVMPLFVLPLVYYVYYQIGKSLFKEKKEIVPVFMIFINMLYMFGNVSLSTPATFLLMRSWQGKALFSNLALPMIFWLFLLMFEDVSAVNEAAGTKEKLKITAPCWIMLALVNVLSCICTELGVALGCGLVAILTIVLLYASKRWTVLVGAFLAVIPNLAYVAFYLILGGGA